ncbi:MAG: PEP-CTERM sorting domain-containing protein [Armatimonadetes bacterium]|nr:PEP-CTERM sorting domain-containing protein [Armatimonadota bacterium]
MRLALVVPVLAFSCFASASFELVMALDSTNHTVHRIDGERSIYLGNFGANRLVNPCAMVVQQSANRAHVYDPTQRAVISFDYNTGEKVGETAMPNFSYATLALGTNGDFLVGDFFTNTARRYNQVGTLVGVFTAPAGAIGTRAMMQAADGNYYIAWSGANVITRHNAAGAILATVTTASTAVSDCRQMFVQNGTVVLSGGSSGKWVRSTYSSSASWGTLTETTFTPFSYGVSGAHFNTIYAGGYPTSGTVLLNSYSLTTGAQMSSYTIPGASNLVALGTVIAPEPQTYLAMLVGGLGILSRRKRRA